MNKINYETFLAWAEKHFDDVDGKGNEVKINSLWAHDTKKHLWCNPSKNAYHCWKTERHGNLYELVMEVDKCSYDDAVDTLGSADSTYELDKKLADFFKKKEIHGTETLAKPLIPNEITLPPSTYKIANLSTSSSYRLKAESYIKARGLPFDSLYVCVAGTYANRIIIPYYAPDGSLIYWNSRDLGNSKLRYRGPDDEEVGVGKRQVLYFPEWPKENDKVYLTEGEFDALALTVCGLRAGACGGKNVHHLQVDLLNENQKRLFKTYTICIAFDADKSGMESLNKIAESLVRLGIFNISYVFPDPKYKDWNKMLEKEGSNAVISWIRAREQKYDQVWSGLLMQWRTLG